MLSELEKRNERLQVAAQIMAGLVSNHNNDDMPCKDLAEWSVALADALIEEIDGK
jgi:hypothetical protein